jgi:tRNA-specific 2-thiouridylase
MSKKVYVGLSGGVDSSVSAALLTERGFNVTGVFIKTWHPNFLKCTWIEDRRDAMKVASKLGIPFKTLDLEKEYKKEVVDYMVREYGEGRTPNPDVMCNKVIKFGGFLDFALKEGADFVATGHYAKNIYNEKTKTHELLEGVDEEKTQSYFLWTLKSKQLENIIFPVGDLQKSKVREIAAKYELDTATKKDSQGLCFLGKVDMKKFLKRFIAEKPGKVVNENGEIVGQHEGAHFFTIGQRQGFVINEKTTERKPYYVVSKNVKDNTLIVSHTPKESAHSPKEVILDQESFVSGERPKGGEYLARIRYRQKLQKVKLSVLNEKISILFQEKQQGLSKGQSLVIYKDNVCLGGGIIT